MNAINRIVVIGNGFDLAHKLPTKYVDFINWYWKDITEITCQTHQLWDSWNVFYYPKFKLKSSAHNYVLVFVLNSQLIEEFDSLCTNEKINQRFKELLKECDFPFFS